MRQPSDGVALAAASRMLDQVALARAVLRRIGEQTAHHIKLVVARPDLSIFALALGADHLRIVLDDVSNAVTLEHFTPQVVGLDAACVGRIPGPVVPAAVEGQEPRLVAFQMSAKPNLVLVNRKVGHAAPELEEFLAGAAVFAILPYGVVHGLLGEVVLQFKGEDGQPVDEEHDVQRPLGVFAAVAQLARDGEAVPFEALPSRFVAFRGGAVEQLEIVGAVADAVAQHVDGAPLVDLALQP